MDLDENDIKVRFLLGKVSDEEQEEIEQEFLKSTSAFEDLLISENALTDAYVSNRLSPNDRLLFEKRLMINPRQRDRVAFAKALVNYASRLPVDEFEDPRSGSRLTTIFVRLFSGQPLLSYSLGAAVFLLVAGAAVWWFSLVGKSPASNELATATVPGMPETSSQLNIPPAEPTPSVAETGPRTPAKDTNAVNGSKPARSKPADRQVLTDAKIVSTIILSMGVTRDAGAASSFVVPKNATEINLQLNVPDVEFPTYFAVVETVEGQQVWRGRAAASATKNAAGTVSITVPARRFSAGDYIVILKGAAKGEAFQTIGEYSFTLDRR